MTAVTDATARPRGGEGKVRAKIGDIEVLRAVAILFVLIQHSPLNLLPWTSGENKRLFFYFGYWNGVDLFFAISGFVIARSLLPTLDGVRDTTKFLNLTLAFWIRRVWRLLPSAWLWLAIIMVCVVFFNHSHAFGTFRANFEASVAAVLDVANFRFVEILFRYEPGASFPYWSLSLEEQFYILLPIVVFLARRHLPYVLAAGVLVQFFITRTGPNTTPLGAVMNGIRSDALLLGVLIAMWSRTPSYRLFEPVALKTHPLLQIGIFAFMLVLFAAIASPNLHLVTFQIGLVALLSAIMVWIASYDRSYLFPDSMLKRVMLWIGARSYGIYLIHIPAYFMAHEIWFRIEPPGTVFTGVYTIRFVLTAIVLLLVFTELNYRFVEVPLRRRGARIAQQIASRLL